MLLAVRGLDRGEDLTRDAELGEGSERSVLSEVEVSDRLEEADHAFLDDVFLVRSGEEVGASFRSGEIAVALEKDLDAAFVSGAHASDEVVVLELSQLGILSRPDGAQLISPRYLGVTSLYVPLSAELAVPLRSRIRLFVLFAINNGPTGGYSLVTVSSPRTFTNNTQSRVQLS